MLCAILVADLWKLGHHNPDQVMSAYCCTEPPSPDPAVIGSYNLLNLA